MANDYKKAIQEAESQIDSLQIKLNTLHQSILLNAKSFNSIFKGNNTSAKEVQITISKVNTELDKLNETKKKAIVINGQVKVKESELAKSMIALNKQREKANKARLKEADTIEKNKIALQKQKVASIELSRAYVKLVNEQKKAKKVLQDLIVTQGKGSRETKKAQKEYDRLTKKVNLANKATSNFSKTGLGSMARGFRNLLGAFGVVGGIQILASMTKEVFSLTREINSLSFSMKAVIKDTVELTQTQEWLKDITKRFGADIVSTTKRYIKFRAASKEANLTASETQKIFGTVTKAAGVLGLKTDELTGIYLALEQMISKGKVTTEELRRQLGERLPGAFDIMAKAVGVSTAELDKMLRKGEILSTEALPKFVVQLEKAYGIESVTKVDTMVAAQIRMNNAWKNLVISVENDGGSISRIFREIFNDFADVLGQIEKLNKDQDDLLKMNRSESYKRNLVSIKEEWSNIVKHAEKTGQLQKIEQSGGYEGYLKRSKEIQEGLNGASSENLQLLFEKRNRLKEIELLLPSSGDEKGALLYEKIGLETSIKGLEVEERKHSQLQGRLDALKELIKLEKKSEDIESNKKGKGKFKGNKVSVLDLDSIDPKKESKKAQEILDTVKKYINKGEDFSLNTPINLDMLLSKETQERLEKYNKTLQETKDKAEQLEALKGIFKDITDTFSEMFDIDISKFDFLFDNAKNEIEDWAKLSKELIGSVLDASLQGYDIQLQEAQRVRDLTLNNDLASEKAKENARKKFDEKERQINNEKAKKERQNALIKIAVDTAVGAVEALPNIPLSIAVAGLGLLQAGIVSSQPLPQFYDGVENSSYQGWATKDERGAEIQLDKHGNIKDLGQNRGSKYTYVERGDTIIPAMQTKSILDNFDGDSMQRMVFDMNMFSNGQLLQRQEVDNSLLREVGSLKASNEKIWGEVKKLASRPINNNVKVELKDDRAY